MCPPEMDPSGPRTPASHTPSRQDVKYWTVSCGADPPSAGGTRWLLGGGDRKHALLDGRAAAATDADFFTHTEAEFALWDLHVRERDMARAIEAARRLAHQFPDNRELAAFREARTAARQSIAPAIGAASFTIVRF